jgi:hypothetical protein
MDKLPVGQIITQSVLLPVSNAKDFVRIAILPVCCAVLVAIIFFLVALEPSSRRMTILISELIAPIYSIFLIVFLVSWHRFVLIGKDASRRRYFQLIQKRDLRFITYGILAGFSILLCVIIFLFGVQIVWALIKLIGTWLSTGIVEGKYKLGLEYENVLAIIPLYFTCHWLLVLPGVAIDEAKPFVKSKQLALLNRLPIFLVIVLVYALSTGAEWIVGDSVDKLISSDLKLQEIAASESSIEEIPLSQFIAALFSHYIYFLIGLIGSAVFATGLSISYLKLQASSSNPVSATN